MPILVGRAPRKKKRKGKVLKRTKPAPAFLEKMQRDMIKRGGGFKVDKNMPTKIPRKRRKKRERRA